MSYSFSISAKSKAEAAQAVGEQFEAIVAGQANHGADQEAVVTAAKSLIDLLGDPTEAEEIYVSMHGSLTWMRTPPEDFTGVSASINVSVRPKS